MFGFRPGGGLQIQGTTGIGGSFILSGPSAVETPAEPSPIGRRIRFLEPPTATQNWINNEIRMYGQQVSWFPSYGMIGTIVELPEPGTIGSGPKIQWDDGHVSWLGSVSPYEYIS